MTVLLSPLFCTSISLSTPAFSLFVSFLLLCHAACYVSHLILQSLSTVHDSPTTSMSFVYAPVSPAAVLSLVTSCVPDVSRSSSPWRCNQKERKKGRKKWKVTKGAALIVTALTKV